MRKTRRKQQTARILLVVLMALALAGCGEKTADTTVTEQDDYFPDVNRSTPVTPSSATQTSQQQNERLIANRETIKTNLKIGGTTQVKINRYQLSGLIRIISTGALNLENFSYNGQCPAFGMYLTRSNNTTLIVVPFGLANRAYQNETIKINFPSSITINDVDSIAIMCDDTKEPMTVERLG
jgi:predicted small lipoprotein YifL